MNVDTNKLLIKSVSAGDAHFIPNLLSYYHLMTSEVLRKRFLYKIEHQMKYFWLKDRLDSGKIHFPDSSHIYVLVNLRVNILLNLHQESVRSKFINYTRFLLDLLQKQLQYYEEKLFRLSTTSTSRSSILTAIKGT